MYDLKNLESVIIGSFLACKFLSCFAVFFCKKYVLPLYSVKDKRKKIFKTLYAIKGDLASLVYSPKVQGKNKSEKKISVMKKG